MATRILLIDDNPADRFLAKRAHCDYGKHGRCLNNIDNHRGDAGILFQIAAAFRETTEEE